MVNFLNIYCKFYLRDSSPFILRSLEQKMRMGTNEKYILSDRLKTLFECFKNVVTSPLISDVNHHKTIVLSTTYSADFKSVADRLHKGEKLNYCEIRRGSFYKKPINLFVLDVATLVIFTLSLFDRKRICYLGIAQSLRLVGFISQNNFSTISIFSTYNITMYATMLCVKRLRRPTVYFWEGTYDSSSGDYSLCDLVMPNKGAMNELITLNEAGDFCFDKKNLRLNKEIERKCFDLANSVVNSKIIGFFSDAWWLRHPGTYFLYTDEAMINRKAKSLDQNAMHLLETEMITNLIASNESSGFVFKLYLHPSELKLNEYILDQIYGELLVYSEHLQAKKRGFNNYREPGFAITLTGLSSIITQRASNSLPTAFLSNQFFLKQNFELTERRAYLSEFMIQCDSVSEVISKMENHQNSCV